MEHNVDCMPPVANRNHLCLQLLSICSEASSAHPHQPLEILLSSEGITQGGPLSMFLYGLTLLQLSECMREKHPDIHQPWYADNLCMAGTSSQIDVVMMDLQDWRQEQGYFPLLEKIIAIIHQPSQIHTTKAQLSHHAW